MKEPNFVKRTDKPHPLDQLFRRADEAMQRSDGATLQSVTETIIEKLEDLEPSDYKDKAMRAALSRLAQAHLFQNDGVRTVQTITKLIPMVQDMEGGSEKSFLLACSMTHLGYAQLYLDDSENAIIAGEQVVETAQKIDNESLRNQTINLGLSLQAFGYLAQGEAEFTEEIIKNKLDVIDQALPEGSQRDQSLITALGIAVLSALDHDKPLLARAVIQRFNDYEGGPEAAKILSGYADIVEGKFDKAYSEALTAYNESISSDSFDHFQMSLLKFAAHKVGADNDYAGYAAQAKDNGWIRPGDTSYDAIGEVLSPEREEALKDELKDTIGQYARSRIFKTTMVPKPIDLNAARVVGLDASSPNPNPNPNPPPPSSPRR